MLENLQKGRFNCADEQSYGNLFRESTLNMARKTHCIV